MKAVARDDDVAVQGPLSPSVAVADARGRGVDAVDGERLGPEEDGAARLFAQCDEVLDDFGLCVDHHGPPAGTRSEVDAVGAAVEPELYALVREALAVHPLSGPRGAQHLGRAVFEDAGTLALLDVIAGAEFQHDAVDSLAVEQMGQQQAGRAGADDAYACAHADSWRWRGVVVAGCTCGRQPLRSRSVRTRCAVAKAALAAGTPQ